MNTIQRRYPQVYKATDQLLLKPETLEVGLQDFTISIKSKLDLFYITNPSLTQEIIPSSAPSRSSSTAASSLPVQSVPLLGDALEKVKEVTQCGYLGKGLTAWEEVEFDDGRGENSKAPSSVKCWPKVVLTFSYIPVHQPNSSPLRC